MLTVIPPLLKRQKKAAQAPREVDLVPSDLPDVLVKFQALDTGDLVGGLIRVPGGITESQLEQLLNQLHPQDESVPYRFALQNGDSQVEIKDTLYHSVLKPGIKTTEDFMTLVFTPRAVFKVKPVTRSGAAISGHGATILCAQFAPHTLLRMVTGAGDNTARVWDCLTQTPLHTLSGHTGWVLCVAWSPDGNTIATGLMDGTVRLWDGNSGASLAVLKGHSKWVLLLAWEPLHLVKLGQVPRLVLASKDTTLKVWDTGARVGVYTMLGHTLAVLCVRWGGTNIIYLGLHDKTIRAWNPDDGRPLHVMKAHAHWVNHLLMLTDAVMRRGGFDHTGAKPADAKAAAQKAYDGVARLGGAVVERMVTASDDFTMYLWEPLKLQKPITRMTGHQKLVNHVLFLPDGRYIVSALFDNSVKLWDGRDGKFLATFRGHVAPVYQTAWSSDLRLLVLCSKDTTLKVWDVATRKLALDLPGHLDEVYAVDWSADGRLVASGGKDKQVRLWNH